MMHEFSICSGIVDAVLSEYEKLSPPPRRLISARIVVGRLHQIVPESLRMAYEILTKDTVAAQSNLDIVVVPVVCKCMECLYEGEIEYPLFLCNQCGSSNLVTVKGKEMYLENLEVEYDE
jgi:hydrogenase nickel incorporation protein HypA/HybF